MLVTRCRCWMSGESKPNRGVAGNPWMPRRASRPPWEDYLSLNGRTTSLRPWPQGGLIMGGGSEVEAGECFFAGLKRRRVIRVLVLYAVAGWIVIEIASVVLPALNLPSWSVTLVIVLVALGFPIAVVMGWMFDIGPNGVARTAIVAGQPQADRKSTRLNSSH